MKNSIFIIFILLFFLNENCLSQSINKQKSKFFLSAGYGLAGSFFVRSYTESLPFPSSTYRNFSKKRFIGNSQDLNIGYRLNKKYDISAGINFQHFTRKVKATDTLASVVIYLDNTIHERNYMYFINVHRIFEEKKHLFLTGIGIYYFRIQSESIEYGKGIPNFYSNYEANYQNSKAEEAGAFVEFAYEYKFQPKVNIGLKTQFYYTISTATAESVTLFPYIKINF